MSDDVTVPEPDPIHDPSNLLPGEPPDPEFEAPTPTLSTSVVDGTGRRISTDEAKEFFALRDDTTQKKFEELIYQAVGAASVCWVGGTGDRVFNDAQARNVANATLQMIGILNEEMRPGFDLIRDTSERLRAKIEADYYDRDDLDAADFHQGRYWRRLEDGTLVSDAQSGPGMTVVIERATPDEEPLIYLVGRTHSIKPNAARWLSLRLAEAAALATTAEGMIP